MVQPRPMLQPRSLALMSSDTEPPASGRAHRPSRRSLPGGPVEAEPETAAAPARRAPGSLSPDQALRLHQLVVQHYSFIWRLLRRMGVQQSVDDAAQQVFMVAGQRLLDVVPELERSFLVGVAVRTAAEHRRVHLKAVSRHAEQEPELLSGGATGTPEDLAARKQTRELLDAALDTLEPDLRSALVLAELEGYSVTQVAELLEIPRGTAASRLRRARERFRESATRLLQGEGLP